MEHKSFKEILIEAIEHHGTTVGKLAEASRVPERYINLLVRGEYDELPASPYLHGYFVRLAANLDLDPELLWAVYKKENSPRTSGRGDHLPANRFSIKTISNTKVILSVSLGLIVVLYIILRFNTLFGKPILTITDPAPDSVITFSSSYTISGSTDKDNKVTVNNDEADLTPAGGFTKNVSLNVGLNTFEIKASKFLGRDTSVIKKIIREAKDSPSPPENNSPATTTDSNI